MPFERDSIRASITSKGFKAEGGEKHEYYWFYVQGKKTKWWIRLSRGSGYKEYSDDLIRRQARLLKLRYRDLMDFFKCTITEVELWEILKKSS